MKINRKNLLIEKESGAYGCPNYIDPEFGKLILNVYNIKSTDEGALLFTEVIENFGLQLIKNVKKELTKEEVIKLTKNLVIV